MFLFRRKLIVVLKLLKPAILVTDDRSFGNMDNKPSVFNTVSNHIALSFDRADFNNDMAITKHVLFDLVVIYSAMTLFCSFAVRPFGDRTVSEQGGSCEKNSSDQEKKFVFHW